MVNALPILSITAGIYTMVVVSVERVRCVVPPQGLEMATPSTRSIGIRGTIIALAVVWVMSIVIAVPAAVNFDVIAVEHTNSSNHSAHALCQSTYDSLQTLIYSLFLCLLYTSPSPRD